ncbi:tRNA (adenine22-N1)-methyltransferase [Anaerosphaera aminiphila DSM 21120]|uniref:tRNA (Adenine22-N1)-methyltransferase n=1 Tax=Anaerosphaera aminiphila DSM 21120 TaxID=1120995 RepID=A0A1M5RIL9_9FIRM|nr:class I SAM-dependent methyltransferase [Anaerosphaera aminiphila]SHH25996.1 tRNA (adenine22-N1)-methyltransferase [Anaerosphaera aminiphila DSM 21120]
MDISNRLKTIAEMVDKGSKVADIGTDHGLIPNFLVNENISDFVICSDISEDSLNKSISLVKDMHNEEKVFPRVGNGLEVLSESEVDTVIIAGMGGQLISDILKKDIELVKNFKRLILQPMQGQHLLRKYLYENNFKIVNEEIIFEDNRFFEIIVAYYREDKNLVEEIFYTVPKTLYDEKAPILKEFLNNKIKYNENIINAIKGEELTAKSKSRIGDLLSENREYRRLICNIE